MATIKEFLKVLLVAVFAFLGLGPIEEVFGNYATLAAAVLVGTAFIIQKLNVEKRLHKQIIAVLTSGVFILIGILVDTGFLLNYTQWWEFVIIGASIAGIAMGAYTLEFIKQLLRLVGLLPPKEE